jgi:hypothetical protein
LFLLIVLPLLILLPDVFTAVCILVAFRTLDLDSQSHARLPELINIADVIARGMAILEKSGALHPLALRYLEFIREWQARLQSLSAQKNVSGPEGAPPSIPLANGGGSAHQPSLYESGGQTLADAVSTAAQVATEQHFGGVDVGSGFFDIENMFDPAAWYEMPFAWGDAHGARTQ